MVAGFATDPGLEVVAGIRRGDRDVNDKLARADVLVDFTIAEAAPELMLAALEAGVRPVSGTSGMTDEALDAVDRCARDRNLPAIWAPNFSLGAVVLGQVAKLAARYLDAVEIIEGHPARKADAPSGTALALARAIRQERETDFTDLPVANQILDGVRGAVEGGVRIHSVRHPAAAMISWHEVIFTSEDGVLTLRHDEAGGIEPVSSVIHAIKAVLEEKRVGLIRGYDAVLGLDT
jgi:4-hydroxy-tetrahydrodipicolinate reductase